MSYLVNLNQTRLTYNGCSLNDQGEGFFIITDTEARAVGILTTRLCKKPNIRRSCERDCARNPTFVILNPPSPPYQGGIE